MSDPTDLAGLVTAIDAIVPPEHAEPWDNTGLLLGISGDPVEKVLLCIDLTDAVVAEALKREVDAIVAYHPPIFTPRTSLTDADPSGDRLLALARGGVGVHSPHTAADAAIGGTNDWLLDVLEATRGEAIQPASPVRESERYKIVTFVPDDGAEAVRIALAKAGAGRIGDYDQCSTSGPVTGTFRGGEGTNPVVGVRGRLERVPETRLEMVCGARHLAAALAGLRGAHPYEEPPIEVHGLEAAPDPRIGAGRIADLDPGATVAELVERLRGGLGTSRLAVHEPRSRRRHRRVGVCAGSGGELLGAAIDRGCTVFVTGELKHHDVLAAGERDCAIVLAGHTNTERGWLKVFRSRLRKILPNVAFSISRADVDPLRSA